MASPSPAGARTLVLANAARPSGPSPLPWLLARAVPHLLPGARALSPRRRHRLTVKDATSRLAHVASVAMTFLWLEFLQSFQVLAILASTLAHAVAFGFRSWVGATVALACQLALLGCNLACHVGVVWMHFGGGAGGCSGIGAWVFNTLLNGALLWVFLHCYGKRGVCDDDSRATATRIKKES